MADGIRVLHEHWALPRHEAASALGATAIEMRVAGCTAEEIMRARPREVLRGLDADPHLWELAAGTMTAAGHPGSTVVGHLLAHAPTPDAFAAGLAVVAPEPGAGVTLAIHYGAQADHLIAASERYELSPTETALALADGGSTAQVTVETLLGRCNHDPHVTIEVAKSAAGVPAVTARVCIERAAHGASPTEIDAVSVPASARGIAGVDAARGTASGLDATTRSLDLDDSAALLSALPAPDHGAGAEFATLLSLPDPIERDEIRATDLQQ